MVNMQPNQSGQQVPLDRTSNEFSENHLPFNDGTESPQTKSVKANTSFKFLAISAIVILLILGIFSAVLFNMNLSKIKTLEEVSFKNSRQLANLNELLGQTLDANKGDELVIPPLNLKLSLEFFKHLNELLAEVDSLTFINTVESTTIEKSTYPTVLPESSKRTANAEVRWWKSIFNQILIPLKTYFSDLVHVQVIDSPVSELAMTNASQALMKKELTLRLLTIRQLVLNGLSQEAAIEVKEVHGITAKNFNLNDDQVKKFITKLDFLVTELDKIKNGYQPNPLPMKAN